MPFRRLHNPGAPVDLRLGTLEVTAFSISGVASYALVRAFDACFDLGHCGLEAARLRHVFLTHVHQDHSLGAIRHASLRQMVGARPSKIYAPAESADDLREVFRAFARMEQKSDADLDGLIRGVSDGEEIPLSGGRRVRAFDVVHRIASRGYTVIETHRTLRAEYVGRPGEEIGEARRRGEVVADETDVPVFTYVGDSTVETLRRHPELGQSEVLFLEVTHLPGTNPAVSEEYGHTHLEQFVAFARENPATLASRHIVLKHFSTRYERREIVAALDELPETLRPRVTLLL